MAPIKASRPSQQEKIGDKLIYKLRSAGVRIDASCTATVICKPNDESCEATQYDAILYVNDGKARSAIKAWAVCGC
jgi:hypothetical protein